MRHATLKFDPRAAGLKPGTLQRAAVGLMAPPFTRGEGASSSPPDLPVGAASRAATIRSRRPCVTVLGLATSTVAVLSETWTDAIEPMAGQLGPPPMFAAVDLLALVGSTAETSNAIASARRKQLDLTLGIAVGSSLQTALFVAPALVFASYGFVAGQAPPDLRFSRVGIAAVVLGAFVALRVLQNGETSGIEGVMAMAVFRMLGYAFYCVPG